MPIFVLTHRVSEVPARHEPAKGLTFTFVTDGVERAVAQAKAAGDKDVQVIGGAYTARQLLRADLLDEIQVSLMPVLLGDGLRLFEDVGSEPRRLEKLEVVDSPVRTDIGYRVVR